MTAIYLDTNAVLKLIELGGEETRLELTRAVVANVARRSFAKDLPSEVGAIIRAEVASVRNELSMLVKQEHYVAQLVEEKLRELRRSIYVSGFREEKLYQDAKKAVEELFGDFIRELVAGHAGGDLKELTEQKTNEVIERLWKRLEGKVAHDADVELRKRADEMVRERVAAVLAGLGQAA